MAAVVVAAAWMPVKAGEKGIVMSVNHGLREKESGIETADVATVIMMIPAHAPAMNMTKTATEAEIGIIEAGICGLLTPVIGNVNETRIVATVTETIVTVVVITKIDLEKPGLLYAVRAFDLCLYLDLI